jgi:hypothetical protein
MNTFFSLLRRYTSDSRGKQTVIQAPNLALGLLIVATIAERLAGLRYSEAIHTVVILLLVVWAGLELWKGDSAFRRTLGLAGLLYAATMVMQLQA